MNWTLVGKTWRSADGRLAIMRRGPGADYVLMLAVAPYGVIMAEAGDGAVQKLKDFAEGLETRNE